MSTGTTAVTAAVESLPFGVAITDPHGTITWANAAYALLSGCTPGDLVGQSAGEFDWDVLAHAAPSSEPYRGRTVSQQKSGDVCSVEHSITTLRNPTGEVTGFWLMKRDATGLRRDAGLPHQAEANLSALIESTNDLIWSVDLDYRLLTFNNALRDDVLSGTAVQVAVGMRPQDWMPPERAALWPPMFARALSEGPFRVEYQVLSGRTLELLFNPIRQDGRKTGVSVFGKDITERKTAENVLREAEAKYRNIFEGAVEGMYQTTVQGRSLAANPALAKILGYDSAEELISAITDTTQYLWIDPHERSRCVQLLEDQEVVRDFECQFRRKDGTAVWVSINLRKACPDEQTAYYEGFIVDITERKRMRDALRKSEEKVAKLFLCNPAVTILFTPEAQGNRIADVNEAFEQNTGFQREEVLGSTTKQLGLWADPSDFDEFMNRFRATGRLRNFEHRVCKKNGEIGIGLTSAEVVELDDMPFAVSATIDITEKKDAEAALYESERRLREMLENTHLVTAMLDEAGTITFCNDFLLRLTGWKRDELMGRDWCSLLVPEGQYNRDLFSKQVSEKTIPLHHENEIITKAGERRTISWNNTMLFDAAGKPIGVATIGEDITERRRMQDALRKSEEKFAIAFKSGPAMTVLFRPDEEGNRAIDVNEAFEQATGYRREEVIGRTSQEIQLYADSGEHGKAMAELRLHGSVRNVKCHFRKKTGDIRTGLLSATSIELDGQPCAIATTIDITEQERAEQARTTLVTAIEQATETIMITDLTGTIQYCNPAFSKVTGYSKEETIGQNSRLLKSDKHDPAFYGQMWATIMQGQVWSGHLTNKRKDGSLYEEDATISPIRDTSGVLSGFVAVKRDVTERLRLEDQLRQAQKLESIGRLAGGVAHDFNNLLTVINGYSGFLLRALKAGNPLRSYAEEITTAGERAASLTKQLLAFSRKQVIEPKVLDLNAIIGEATGMLRRLIGDDILLETHLDSSLGQVMADPDQMHQVIMNLAVNARDAMPDGGALDIETLNCELTTEDCTASHPNRSPGRYVLMTVTDTGHGMDETTRKQIFEPFFTTKGVGKGTGLGLSTVYGIIRQNGGWIDVWSEVAVGTTFKMYLSRIDASPVAERKGTIAASESGGETVLIVEDQEAVRSFAKAALRQHGYQVIHAGDGDQALSVAKQHSGQIHLLITDVIMPGINGKELSIRLKELCPNLKVLFISGYTADVIAQRGVLDPGVAFLHKPFGQEELAQKVREVLDASPLPSLEP